MAFSTWNPSDKNANVTLSNGDLTATTTNTAWTAVRGTLGVSSGKYYWEITIDVAAGNSTIIGVGTLSETLTYPGDTLEGYGYNGSNGQKWHDSAASYGATFTASDIISVALDLDNGKIWWGKNGTWQASGDPGAGTNEAFSGLTGTFYAMIAPFDNTNSSTANFGASAFSYTVPTGFIAGLFDFSGQFTGDVLEQSNPVVRTIYLHRRDTGVLVDTTTSSGNGAYTLTTTYSGAHYIVCLDDDAGESFNDLILGNMIPTTVSG